MAEVLADPQVIHLGLVYEVNHPQAGTFKFVGSPVNYSDLPKGSANPPPLLGEHTEAILAELGYSKAAIKKLHEQGVVRT